MKNKKLAIIGKGTAGSISLVYFLNLLRGGEEIDVYYNPNLPEQAVGEGTDLSFPNFLWKNLNMDLLDLYHDLDGTYKTGIRKINYKGTGDFFHQFSLGNNGVHFNASKFQKIVYERFKNRVNFIPKDITHPSDIDANHIIDCSGRPQDYKDFNQLDSIPVNSTHIVQCYWEKPRFDYTFTIARPYGWVFMIPLQNRVSVGYLYNNTFNNLEEIKEDINNIFREYNLVPSNKTNSFNFSNYYRKENFTDRVTYNGNASFFLEPLEATSISTILEILKISTKVSTGFLTIEEANLHYSNKLQEHEQMIMMHYFAGSKFNTPFWQYAYEKSLPHIKKLTSSLKFKQIFKEGLYNINNPHQPKILSTPDFSSWGSFSFLQNIPHLGLLEKIDNLIIKNQKDSLI